MGQGIIRTALQNLGGKATKQQIAEELQRMNASASLQKTVTDRLNKMRKRYEVNKVYEKGIWFYQLTKTQQS